MRTEGNLGPLGSMILGLIFIVVGVPVALFIGKPMLDNAKASVEWPQVDGTVIESEVTTSRSDGKTMYSAHVLYEYKVGSKKYKADTISFGGSYSSNSSSTHHAIVDHYPKGKKVEVYYNPDSHETAVLEPGATWKSYVVLVAGGVFAFIGVLMVGIPLAIVGTAIFAGGRSSSKKSPWQDDTTSQPWTGGSSEAPDTSDYKPAARVNPVDLEDDGIDLG